MDDVGILLAGVDTCPVVSAVVVGVAFAGPLSSQPGYLPSCFDELSWTGDLVHSSCMSCCYAVR